MSIEFRCGSCGKMLRAPEEHQGAEARCPVCGALTVVPTPQQAAAAAAPTPPLALPVEEEEETGVLDAEDVDEPSRPRTAGRRCPECDAPMEARAVLCVNCGY